MPYPQNADYIECRIEAIERKVPGRTLGDDKFTNVMVDAPPDEWMGFQDAHSASDGHERLRGSVGGGFQQELYNAFKLGERLI